MFTALDGYCDVLDYLILPDGVRQATAIDGNWDVLTAPDANGRCFRYRIKNALATHFDISVVTKDFVSDRSTSMDDGNPQNLKIHGGNTDGFKMFPRSIPKTDFRVATRTPSAQATFVEIRGCQQTKQNNLGNIEHVLSGYHQIELPDLGVFSCLLHEFIYNDGNSMERNTYAKGLGWVKWQLFAMKNGILQVVQTTIHKKTAKAVPPAFGFPCPKVAL